MLILQQNMRNKKIDMKKSEELKAKADKLVRDNAPISEIKKARNELIKEVENERKSLYLLIHFDTLEQKNEFKSKASIVGQSMQERILKMIRFDLR